MKHNVNEKKAREWLIKSGHAKAETDFITVFPDLYVISSNKFFEVKTLHTLRYGQKKKMIGFSGEQYVQFEKLNPWILIFENDNDEPVWQGSFRALITQLPTLPFRLCKQHRSQ